ncbi:MAG: metal-dependent hydrolase, partial [Proteobacteria bacterium]|nr:metal-dependent hydrolase [Pseudomonadota bacterium]
WLEWQRQARGGHLPSLFWLTRQQLSFFRPNYDPLHEASTEDALAYLAASPAAARAAA